MKYLKYVAIGLLLAVISESEVEDPAWVVLTVVSAIGLVGGWNLVSLVWKKDHEKISLNILVRLLCGYGGLVVILLSLLGLAVGLDGLF